MYKILEGLNKTSGILGSLVVGRDGIVIAADLNTQVEDETIGALAASITANIHKSLERIKAPDLKQITIEAENAKLFFCDAQVGILVVVTEPQVNIGLIRLEIKNSVNQLNSQEAPC